MTESEPCHSMRWDIFCRVIDNFGDAGVCWRLARQLVCDQGQAVQLWIDDLHVLAKLVPHLDTRAERQCVNGIDIRHWTATDAYQPGADVIIEAFGCAVPAGYLRAINRPTLWLNLEYLSAEGWVEGCHLLPSPVAQTADQNLKKFFFFPGFTEKTGGLLREADLISRREAFKTSTINKRSFLQHYGLTPEPDALLISLFSYENPALETWLTELAHNPTAVHLFIPEGRVLTDVSHWLGAPTLHPGDHHRRGQCHVHILPFITPDDYDRLLWCCDLNIVRGEDSFLRAQWAAAPFVWHIYPQDNDVHFDKLDAFLNLHNQSLTREAGQAVSKFWHDWNQGHNMCSSWRELRSHWTAIETGAQAWSKHLCQQKNISQQLVTFAKKQLIFAPRNIS